MRRIAAFDPRTLWPRSATGWTRVVLAAGAALRLREYQLNRGIWMDEQFLELNIVNVPIFRLTGTTTHVQVAPPGFLILERMITSTLGGSALALRLLPFACGIASLFLFYALARRVLSPRGVLVATALFAFADELIYYSAEAKQYGCDVTVALACTLAGFSAAAGELTPPRRIRLMTFGAVILWFSHTAAFVLGGVGLTLIIARWRAGRKDDALKLAWIAWAWLLSFASCYYVTKTQLGYNEGAMTRFWHFSFPNLDAALPVWFITRFLHVFINPLDFYGFGLLDPRLAAFPAIVAFTIGACSLARSNRLALGMLMMPCAVAMFAAAARAYPFHGRLVLFTAPSFLLLIAAGVDTIWTGWKRPALAAAFAAALLAGSVLNDVWFLTGPRERIGLNRHGDRRPDWLQPDYFLYGMDSPLRLRR